MEENTKLTKKQFLRAAGPAMFFMAAALIMSCDGNDGGVMDNNSKIKCADCPMRARYDRNPKALLSRIWKWHTGWCPGWKSYLASLPEDERTKVMERYR